jgi:hypothetical protein
MESKIDLSSVIDDLLCFVDFEDCPSAWPPDNDSEFLLDQAKCTKVFALVDRSSDEEIETILDGMTTKASRFYMHGGAAARNEVHNAFLCQRQKIDVVPVCLGVVLGLRMGGVSKSVAKAIMRGFLRNFADADPEAGKRTE